MTGNVWVGAKSSGIFVSKETLSGRAKDLAFQERGEQRGEWHTGDFSRWPEGKTITSWPELGLSITSSRPRTLKM